MDESKVVYMEADETAIDRLEMLWSQLNEHHRKSSKYFTDFFAENSFAKRKTLLMEKNRAGNMRILISKDADSNALVGYCISTVIGDDGEIDSLFVLPEYRGWGIGDHFMKDAIEWLNEKNVKTKHIAVAYGNDEVINFYHKYGFFERTIVLLERK